MILNPDLIETQLAASPECDVRVMAETASTNSTLLDWGRRGMKAPVALFAESQTAGRGRRGRSWQAEPGTALTGSLMLHPDAPPERWRLLTLAAGIALADAMPAAVRVKWPNDLYADDRKLGGILVETQISSPTSGFVVVGFGLNINQSTFGGEIADRAVSLRQLTGDAHDINQIAGNAVASLLKTLPLAWQDPRHILERFEQLDCVSGRTITAMTREQSEPVHGVATGIDGGGRLIVRLPGGGFHPLEDAWEIRW
ncbi:biotin--[acetyl-CoA-carboxylase] ligase [Sulfuriroseicoccus oceanibius]|uniref:biotin--[biotin carboxyl-carrier protein] ligase n=1 Tax=Sulfuriroseicoccus oceanibius TaxID=2707525 RepID=A0A6B3L4C0_9BACT|nr:biotin--[acetyl-CoA-carboxylase] ligase [Sulfuriroseicoccus oceanibius]QQL45288.1 biotin--[acetyl-CoA-carboxylase] ligase [Sulfuriroseicoccus oceanibius]